MFDVMSRVLYNLLLYWCLAPARAQIVIPAKREKRLRHLFTKFCSEFAKIVKQLFVTYQNFVKT